MSGMDIYRDTDLSLNLPFSPSLLILPWRGDMSSKPGRDEREMLMMGHRARQGAVLTTEDDEIEISSEDADEDIAPGLRRT